MNVVLIGMPGAGKSRIGFALAERTCRRFIDTDRLVRKAHGDIAAVFAEEGEAKFREYEREAVREAAKHLRSVISTGGGVVTDEENMRLLKKRSFVVFLDASVGTVAERILRSKRPIADKGVRGIEELYEKRRPLYLRYADLVVDGNGYGVDDKVEKILQGMKAAEEAESPRRCREEKT